MLHMVTGAFLKIQAVFNICHFPKGEFFIEYARVYLLFVLLGLLLWLLINEQQFCFLSSASVYIVHDLLIWAETNIYMCIIRVCSYLDV